MKSQYVITAKFDRLSSETLAFADFLSAQPLEVTWPASRPFSEFVETIVKILDRTPDEYAAPLRRLRECPAEVHLKSIHISKLQRLIDDWSKLANDVAPPDSGLLSPNLISAAEALWKSKRFALKQELIILYRKYFKLTDTRIEQFNDPQYDVVEAAGVKSEMAWLPRPEIHLSEFDPQPILDVIDSAIKQDRDQAITELTDWHKEAERLYDEGLRKLRPVREEKPD